MSKIVWKKHDLSMEFDGKKVHAEIIWWAKDYYILVNIIILNLKVLVFVL